MLSLPSAVKPVANKKYPKKGGLLFPIAALLLFAVSCSAPPKEVTFRIGFSQCQGGDEWRKTMLAEMKRELAFYDDVEFIMRDAEADSKKQLAQIDELLRLNIDLLIVSPHEVQPLTPKIEKVFDSGMPVVLVDRGIQSEKYTAFVGASNFEVGQNAGRYTASLLKGKGNIVEVMGLSDASPFIDRHKGFTNVISQYPGLTYQKRLDDHAADYEKELTRALSAENNIDLVFAQSDYIALSVYKVSRQSGVDKKIKIIGVDGLPADSLGMGMVANKLIAATVLYPTGGQEAIATAMKILERKPYNRENQLFTTIIDSSNVRILRLQNEKVESQQRDIDRRQQKIERQLVITRSQTNIILTISISLGLALVLGGILFYYLRENKKINRRLAGQNEEIISQRNQLIELGKQAQEATDAKFNFFTNISHEFRTPLTLILGPLEELLADKKNNYAVTQSLTLIQKNVIRLLRLVNQLIDFRRIEVDKMKIRASETDLLTFTAEIIQAYKSIAEKRKIDLRIITGERQLNVWFDESMMDKVIFNLLSNAFKFTNDSGFIHVYIGKSDDGKQAMVKVEDNGIGMTKEVLAHLFEAFYQGEFQNGKGSGLGLALSKDLVRLHKGSISVKSEPGKGAAFEVCLPLGRAHLTKEETPEGDVQPLVLYEHEKVYETQLENNEPYKNGLVPALQNLEKSILIIEDNTDLRLFLHNRLQNNYEILEAENSQTALQVAFDIVPDLIICDVVIPGKNGLELTHIFKSDVRTSHIPIILLTSKTAIDQQIEGMKNRADVYITKPFNLHFLEETIQSLLTNRAKLKEHYTGELTVNLKSQTINKPDRKFIHDFMSLVESNIDNEDFTAEDICKSIGISRVQLYRKVKALLDINVNDYIVNTRLQKAKYLLQNEELTIGEIAYKVGFSTPAYFSTVFKSKFGVTPKAYRERDNDGY